MLGNLRPDLAGYRVYATVNLPFICRSSRSTVRFQPTPLRSHVVVRLGVLSFRSANVSRSRWATAQSRYHLRSAGSTYQGAASDARARASAYAAW